MSGQCFGDRLLWWISRITSWSGSACPLLTHPARSLNDLQQDLKRSGVQRTRHSNLRAQSPARWFFHYELVMALVRSKGEIDWALQFLRDLRHIKSEEVALPGRKSVFRYSLCKLSHSGQHCTFQISKVLIMKNPYPAAAVNLKALFSKVQTVRDTYIALLDCIEGPPPKSVMEPASTIAERLSSFYERCGNNNIDLAVDSADAVGIYGISIADAWKQLSSLKNIGQEIADRLKESSQDLRMYAAAHVGSHPTSPPPMDDAMVPSALLQSFDAIDKRYAGLAGAVENTERQIAVLQARFKALGEIADASAERVEAITATQADIFRKELNEQVEEIRRNFTAVSSKIGDQLAVFEGYNTQALRMLDQMAATTLSGGYVGSSAKEESSANLFRWFSIGLMAATLLFLGSTLFELSFTGLEWRTGAIRVAISLLMAVPTAYLARESAKHRAQAIELRRTSLDFSVMEPFLKTVEGEAGAKLRAELALRVFFQSGRSDEAPSYGLDPQAIIIKGMDTIADLAKQKKA